MENLSCHLICSFPNLSDLPFRGDVPQAFVEYFLEDCGMIEGSNDLVDLVLQLTDEPYQVASMQRRSASNF